MSVISKKNCEFVDDISIFSRDKIIFGISGKESEKNIVLILEF